MLNNEVILNVFSIIHACYRPVSTFKSAQEWFPSEQFHDTDDTHAIFSSCQLPNREPGVDLLCHLHEC